MYVNKQIYGQHGSFFCVLREFIGEEQDSKISTFKVIFINVHTVFFLFNVYVVSISRYRLFIYNIFIFIKIILLII